eukprot:1047325-Prorocentrum_minimum.AAC.2
MVAGPPNRAAPTVSLWATTSSGSSAPAAAAADAKRPPRGTPEGRKSVKSERRKSEWFLLVFDRRATSTAVLLKGWIRGRCASPIPCSASERTRPATSMWSRGGPERVQRGSRGGSDVVQRGSRAGPKGVQRGSRCGPEGVQTGEPPVQLCYSRGGFAEGLRVRYLAPLPSVPDQRTSCKRQARKTSSANTPVVVIRDS